MVAMFFRVIIFIGAVLIGIVLIPFAVILIMLDPELRGLFASVGIQKGKPFAPDERMRKILEEAVAAGPLTIEQTARLVDQVAQVQV